MPRGSHHGAVNYCGEGGVFHLTHRCHNRAFLLKFARDRDAYRASLREHLHQFDMALPELINGTIVLMVLVGDRGVMLGIGTAGKVFNS